VAASILLELDIVVISVWMDLPVLSILV